jgi:hypothetical protein
MDIGKAFTFVFQDKDWIPKVLIGIGILVAGLVLSWLVVPAIVAGLLLGGYSLEITRRVIRGHDEVLPAWEDWGQLIIDGLQVALIGIVYALPIIILAIFVSVPMEIIADYGATRSGLSFLETMSAFVSVALSCVNLLWAIAMSLVLPAAIGRFAAEGELASAFRFGEIIALVRDNLATYVITAVMVWATGIMAGLGLLLCLIGVFFTAVYAELVTGHLYGQAYLEATGQTRKVVAEVAS